MTEKGRSAASVKASRANGARSRGPRSAAGKQASARNALKHGLFSLHMNPLDTPSAAVSGLAAELQRLADGNWKAGLLFEAAISAAMQLERAGALVKSVRDEVELLLSAEAFELDLLTNRIETQVRLGRYELRFRRRRDRAIRKVIALSRANQRAGLGG